MAGLVVMFYSSEDFSAYIYFWKSDAGLLQVIEQTKYIVHWTQQQGMLSHSMRQVVATESAFKQAITVTNIFIK